MWLVGTCFVAAVIFITLMMGVMTDGSRYDDEIERDFPLSLLVAAILAASVLSPAPAEALTKHECIHLGYGCQWSKATGGRVNGWYFTKAKETRNVRNADGPRLAVQHPQSIAVRVASADASRSALASQRHPRGAVEPEAAAEAQERQQAIQIAPLPLGCPQARINEAFAVMGMGR